MDGFSGNVSAGFGTFANDLRVDGNFIVNGDYTTLNTTLREVEILRVDANTAASVAAGIITQAGAGDILRLYDGTSPVVTVIDGGKVGIGLTNPTTTVDIKVTDATAYSEDGVGVGQNQLRINNAGASGVAGIRFDAEPSSGSAGYASIRTIAPASGSADLIFSTRNSSTFAERLRITSAGRVGIGSTASSAPLNVQAETSTGVCLRLNQEPTDKKAYIQFQDYATNGVDSYILNEGYDLTVYGGYSGKLNLGAYDTTGITVFSTGKVGVGTTTALNAGVMTLYSANVGEGTATGQLELKDTGAYDSTPTGGIIFSGHHAAGSQAIFSGIRGFKANTGDGDYDGCLGFDVRKHGAVAYEAMRINEDAQIIKQRDSTNRTDLKTYTANDAFLIDHYQYQSGSTYRRYIDLVAGGSGNHGSIIRLFTMPDSTDSSGVPKERFRITEAGKVCINTGTPGGANADDFTIAYNENETSDTGRAGMTIRSTTTQRGYIYFADGTSGDNPHRGQIQYEHNGDEFQIGAAGYMQLKIKEAGIEPTDYLQQTNDYPNYRPTLDFNFAAVKKLDPRFTYTRTGPGSYVDHLGFVRLVGPDSPRFDHDPITGECKGLLIEDSRTNYVLDSKMLTGWSYGESTDAFTASSGSQLSANPDGSSPAYHYVPSSSSGHHRYNETVTVPTLDTEYVISVFVKRVTTGSVSTLNRYVELESTGDFNGNSSGTGQSGSNGGSNVVYDLENVSVHPGQSDNDRGYVGGAKIEDYGNGWYRCSYVFNPGSGSNSTGTIWWGHTANTSGDTGNETGNGNPSFYFWGASVEQGSFLTSYIPTNGSTATRFGDYVSIAGDEHTDFWNTSEGTYLIDYKPLELAVGNGVIIGSKRGNDGSGYPWPLYRHDTANTNIFKSYDLNGIVSINNAWVDQREVWALGFNGTNGSIVRNGTQLITNNSNMRGLIDANELWLGSSSTGSLYSMHVKRFMYYAKRITDSQLITLTS